MRRRHGRTDEPAAGRPASPQLPQARQPGKERGGNGVRSRIATTISQSAIASTTSSSEPKGRRSVRTSTMPSSGVQSAMERATPW